jgi:hypothetical protein
MPDGILKEIVYLAFFSVVASTTNLSTFLKYDANVVIISVLLATT